MEGAEIVSFLPCSGCCQIVGIGKIRLLLVPLLGQQIIISQKTAPAFRKGMDR